MDELYCQHARFFSGANSGLPSPFQIRKKCHRGNIFLHCDTDPNKVHSHLEIMELQEYISWSYLGHIMKLGPQVLEKETRGNRTKELWTGSLWDRTTKIVKKLFRPQSWSSDLILFREGFDWVWEANWIVFEGFPMVFSSHALGEDPSLLTCWKHENCCPSSGLGCFYDPCQLLKELLFCDQLQVEIE